MTVNGTSASTAKKTKMWELETSSGGWSVISTQHKQRSDMKTDISPEVKKTPEPPQKFFIGLFGMV